jgi:putative transposase
VLEDLIAQGVAVSRTRVARLMREEGLVARVRKRFRPTTMSEHDQPIAANVLDRQFAADRPNQRWVGDTTEFAIGSSAEVYLAAILDLHSRFVVGWALSAVNDRHLTLSALDKALIRRCPDTGLLHHSDQGCTLGFKGPSQRVRVSLSLSDFEVPLPAFSNRVFFAADC